MLPKTIFEIFQLIKNVMNNNFHQRKPVLCSLCFIVHLSGRTLRTIRRGKLIQTNSPARGRFAKKIAKHWSRYVFYPLFILPTYWKFLLL
jgi:hypothetical protein